MKLSDYPSISVACAVRQVWLMLTPVVNTGHLTWEDMDWFQCENPRTINGVHHYVAGTSKNDASFFSPTTRHILEHFAELSYSTVRFDPDGDVFEDLPQFDW